MTSHKASPNKVQKAANSAPALLDEIRRLIADARAHVATTANATLTLLYWRIGR
jgi:hypothetical protein